MEAQSCSGSSESFVSGQIRSDWTFQQFRVSRKRRRGGRIETEYWALGEPDARSVNRFLRLVKSAWHRQRNKSGTDARSLLGTNPTVETFQLWRLTSSSK